MSSVTKDEILQAAQALFLQKGLESVGMRDISQVLGISVGNLTYHFNKKETLIEEVVTRMFARYQRFPAACTLQTLDEWLGLLENLVVENALYFRDFALFARLSEKVREIQLYVCKDNDRFWAETFSLLIDAKLVQPEGFRGHHQRVWRTLHFMKNHWGQRQAAEKNLGEPPSSYRIEAWALLFPLLTEEGQAVYLNKIRRRKRGRT